MGGHASVCLCIWISGLKRWLTLNGIKRSVWNFQDQYNCIQVIIIFGSHISQSLEYCPWTKTACFSKISAISFFTWTFPSYSKEQNFLNFGTIISHPILVKNPSPLKNKIYYWKIAVVASNDWSVLFILIISKYEF